MVRGGDNTLTDERYQIKHHKALFLPVTQAEASVNDNSDSEEMEACVQCVLFVAVFWVFDSAWLVTALTVVFADTFEFIYNQNAV